MNIFNDTLIQASVSIQSDEYGMRAYVNSIHGRTQLESECPAEIVADVYKVWGDTPTVTEPVLPTIPVSTTPTIDDRVRALEAAQLAALGV